MPVYPALHATLPRRTEDPNALRAGYAIGGDIARKQRANELVELRRQALEAGMMGDAGGQPDYFSGEGPSPEAGGMGFGAFQGPQGTPGPLGQQPGAGVDTRASPNALMRLAPPRQPARMTNEMANYYASDPKGARELHGFVASMDAAERKLAASETRRLAQLLNWVQQAATPEEAAERYDQALILARRNGLNVDDAPPIYDAAWVGSHAALATTLEQQFKRAAGERKEAGLTKRAGIAARGKAPAVKTFYDKKSGLPYSAQWDPNTKKWLREGGTKSAALTKAGQDPARVREANWLVKNKIFPDLKTAYAATRTRVAMDPQAVRVKGLAWIAAQKDRYGRPKYSTPEQQAQALKAYQLFAAGETDEAVAELKKLEPAKKADKTGWLRSMYNSLTGAGEAAPAPAAAKAKAATVRGPDGKDYPSVSDQESYDNVPAGGTYYHATKKQFLKKAR